MEHFELTIDAPLGASAAAALTGLDGIRSVESRGDALTLVFDGQVALVAGLVRIDALGLGVSAVCRVLGSTARLQPRSPAIQGVGT